MKNTTTTCCNKCSGFNDVKHLCFNTACPCHTKTACCSKCYEDSASGVYCNKRTCECHSQTATEESMEERFNKRFPSYGTSVVESDAEELLNFITSELENERRVIAEKVEKWRDLGGKCHDCGNMDCECTKSAANDILDLIQPH